MEGHAPLPRTVSPTEDVTEHLTLVTQQKSVQKPSPQALEVGWRFRREPATRSLWLRVLPSVSSKPSEIERFNHCGENAWVERSASTGRVRVRASHCGLRICPACRRNYARKLADRAQQLMENRPKEMPLFITLTLKPSAQPLGDRVAFLRSSFRRLRLTKPWKNAVDYGLAVIEVTRGKHKDHWHVHLHVLAWSRFIASGVLSTLWRRITRGSFVVDVQRARNKAKVRAYVSDYIAKPPDEACFNNDALAAEWYDALQRQHWVLRFGKRKLLPCTVKPQVLKDWLTICRLVDLLPLLDGGNVADAAARFEHQRNADRYNEVCHRVCDSS